VRDGRVLWITGASSGLGEHTARAAVEQGWRVVLSSRSLEKLEQLARDLGGPSNALAIKCDVTEWADQEAAVAGAVRHFGSLDATWANAGFGSQRSFLLDDPEHWRALVLTNVLGAAFSIRASFLALKESRGHLVLTGSVAGRRGIPGSLYSATKHAVHALAESARLELNGSGVRVTLIAPGMVKTPFFDRVPGFTPLISFEEALQPEDVSRAVLFALSQPSHVDVNELLIRPTAQAT
jgi:NADP-dependent 3-hydroxy acid dehydrogenase YdfG